MNFYFAHRIHNDSGAHPASYPAGRVGSSREVMRLEYETTPIQCWD